MSRILRLMTRLHSTESPNGETGSRTVQIKVSRHLPLNSPLLMKKINHCRNTRSTETVRNTALLAKQSHCFRALCWISWINVEPTGLADWRRMDPIYFPTQCSFSAKKSSLICYFSSLSSKSKESMEERILLTVTE